MEYTIIEKSHRELVSNENSLTDPLSQGRISLRLEGVELNSLGAKWEQNGMWFGVYGFYIPERRAEAWGILARLLQGNTTLTGASRLDEPRASESVDLGASFILD